MSDAIRFEDKVVIVTGAGGGLGRTPIVAKLINSFVPNEHLLAPVAREGLAVMAGLFWDLGRSDGVPWKDGALPAAAL